jgi:hypothetical protein
MILLIPVLLVSCYTQTIILNPDKKSGRMIIDYQMDDDYLSILSTAMANFQNPDQEPIDPTILIDQELFKERFKNSKEVALDKVVISSKNGYTGHVEIRFSDFEKALKMLPEGMINLAINRSNSKLSIGQVINLSKMDPDNVLTEFLNQQKEDDIDLYNKLTKSASFSMVIQTPSPVSSSKGVTLSSDKKKSSYSFRLGDMLAKKDKDLEFYIEF